MNSDLQRTYFHNVKNRYPQKLILYPPPAQQLELTALEQALGLPPGTQLIDFGCGSGRLTIYFLRRGFNVLGVDISSQSLRDLSKLYQRVKQPNWGKLTTATQLPDKPYAAGVVGADILHHIDLSEKLPQLRKALKAKGRVAFSEPNAWHLPWYLYYLISGIPWPIERGILQCSYFNLKQAFQKARFSQIKISGHGLIPTSALNWLPSFNRWQVDNLSNLPVFKLFAFRYLISARI